MMLQSKTIIFFLVFDIEAQFRESGTAFWDGITRVLSGQATTSYRVSENISNSRLRIGASVTGTTRYINPVCM